MNDQPTTAYLFDALAALMTSVFGSTPTTVKLKLAKAPFVPGPTLDPATITEADYTGYAAQVVSSFGAAHADGTGQVIFDTFPPLAFTPTGTTTANTIYGYYLEDTQGNIAVAGLFPNPVVLNGPLTTLAFALSIPMAPGKPVMTLLP